MCKNKNKLSVFQNYSLLTVTEIWYLELFLGVSPLVRKLKHNVE